MMRPHVSVCIAAYNGERFIKEQLTTILAQLAPEDEVVIVDDASNDRTVPIIQCMRDDRIRLLKNDLNLGVLASFERVISAASGEVIFLSDQDDLWAPDKVRLTLEAFQQHPEISVVVSNGAIIDSQGERTGSSIYGKRSFTPSVMTNLIHSRFVGCVMAFQSRLRARILPFPSGFDLFHDIWIGTRNTMSGGKTLYMDKPLTLYRQHAGNLTAGARLSRTRQLRIRCHLIWSLSRSWISDRINRAYA